MECKQFNSVEEYLENCQSFLMENETENSLPLGIALAFKNKNRSATSTNFFAIKEQGKIVAIAQRSEVDRPLFLTPMNLNQIELICDKVIDLKIPLEGVLSRPQTSENFAKIFSNKMKLSTRLSMHQGIYQLKNVNMPKLNGEKLELAGFDQKKTCYDFMLGFIKECFPHHKSPEIEAKKQVDRLLDNNNLYLLKNKSGHFVSMVGNSRNTPNGASLSFVYTPNNQRKKGYGGMVTALLSKLLLEKGFKFCNLYTDLQNPTSNSIYQKIGYKMIAESKHISFV